jgi:hypothetical protein
VSDELAERIAAAVLAHPAVANMHAGPFGSVASHLPGRRLDGVRVDGGGSSVQVAVAVHFGQPLRRVANELRSAVRELAGDVPVDVLIADLVMPEQTQPRAPMEDSR